eukprot:CAMPEP_0172199018 /NCGR_PEP_ID=MMETSP1050-20130122/28436_1 /TAXON_ID=233186 /ORGANISM="Cryptomonas curvata, Strain CCAP979/52" /LENGTH=164 /DNA_ID=CAMNT_0012875957 /DNA_START=66 /DNA_END=557 /DNA_ORIENTATION=-
MSKRLAAVSAVISLGALAVITIAVSMKSISYSELVEKDTSASQLNAKVLGLKEADMRLLQAALHAQKSKDVKTCGLGCGGDDADCVTLCGRPDGKGHAALPAQTFKKLMRLTKKAVADKGSAFGLAASDVSLLQSALRQQAKEQVKACRSECRTQECTARCHSA